MIGIVRPGWSPPGRTSQHARSWARLGLRHGRRWSRREKGLRLIDLHCHLLPEIDDGAPDLATAIEMARLSVADGVRVIACTPHIFPGVYPNAGPDIRRRMAQLQAELDAAHVNCRLVSGSDAHVTPDFLDGLKSGRILSLADGRYVLVEPPHQI